MKRFSWWICVAAALLMLGGCSWFRPKEEKFAQELASDGMDAYAGGDYRDAIQSFEKLKDFYPFSKYAILAQLKIADAYFHLEEWEEAIAAYQEFESLHPRNEATPYVVYQIGMSYFKQIDTTDRDQSTARQALETFSRLKKQFPESPYATKAEEHIKASLRSLVGHEFNVGLFYYKGKHYKAALGRFMAIVTKYPDVGLHHEALQYIALCQEKLRAQGQ
jgi:outer membrane protein assembly factor BamD